MLIACGLLAMGCSPQWQVIGPPTDTPAFTATAFHTADGVDLPLLAFLPWDRPVEGVIVALHGFNDYSRGMAPPAKGLARRGFAVYAYDQRGFGRAPQRGLWAGTAPMVDDMLAAARLARAAHPGKPVYLLGESMGAAVILAAIDAGTPLPVDGIILAAPAIWGFQTQGSLNRAMLDLAMAVMPRVSVTPRGVHREPSSNHQMLRLMGRDPRVIKATRVDTAYGLVELMTQAYDAAPKLVSAPRWLMLFGGREDILAADAVGGFLRNLPRLKPEKGRLALYPHAHHMLLRDLDARFLYDDIAAWIRDPETPLPRAVSPEAVQAPGS